MSTLKVGGIRGVSASSDAITVANDGTCTANITSVNGGQLGNRNIIINGEHKIDQRNSGSAVTINGGGFGGRKFVTDRFSVQHNGTASVTGQQVTDTPAGYKNSLKMTVATAESSVDAADYLFIGYRLEGNDASVLECGTSDAKEFTVSFWVKSSITGTYTLSFSNYADNRSHRKEYTISSADTWEHKTVTLTADTTGTWLTNNSGGLNVTWMLLGGSNSVGAANTWTADIKNVTSNQTQWASTLGATFFITGIQLELGGVATEFEHKPITEDLALCQRYYQTIGVGFIAAARGASSSQLLYSYTPPVNLRASPSVSTTATGFHGNFGVRSYRDGSGTSDSTTTPATQSLYFEEINPTIHITQGGFSVTDDRSATIFINGGAITLDAEL